MARPAQPGRSLPSQATLRLEETPPLARYALYLATSDVQLRAVLQNYVTHWQHIQPRTDGHALQKARLCRRGHVTGRS